MSTSKRSHRRIAWVLLLIILIIGLAVVITPIWIIQPFKPQTQRGLELSYLFRRVSPFATVVASLAFLLMTIWLWRGTRWFLKMLLVLLLLPLFAATWMARQNHFEWIFRPHASIAYSSVPETNFVGDNDMVLAVKNNGEAVAYPVRLMAYHHLVQDVVGGTPLVATY
jgi:MFS family permease